MDTLTIRFEPTVPVARALRSSLAAQALRASAANGFGDAPVVPTPRPAAGALQRLRAACAAWLERRREAARQRRDLRLIARLDATTLRDLGIDPGEVQSLVAELHGTAAATRRWTDRAHAGSSAARMRINSVDCFL